MFLRKLTFNFEYFGVGEEAKLLLEQSGVQNLSSLKRHALFLQSVSKVE